jgi:hypothetical protein
MIIEKKWCCMIGHCCPNHYIFFLWASVDLIPVYYYSSFWGCPWFAFCVYYIFTA